MASQTQSLQIPQLPTRQAPPIPTREAPPIPAHTPDPSPRTNENRSFRASGARSYLPPTNELASRSVSPPSSIPAGFEHPDVSHIQGSARLSNIIQIAISQHKIPSLAIVVVKNGEIIDRAAFGTRKTGSPASVTTNDLWHIGSCSKSFVGTLAGRMVAKGMIHWHTTIGEVFPELRQRMHPAYESVTIEQLLQHRGGVPGTADPGAWSTAWQRKGTVQEQRYEFVASTLSLPPANTPGTSVEYSNQGTTIVAAMLERVCGKDWETLNLEEVCKPLGIKSVGYGVPGDLQAFIPDQPWGHQRVGPSSSPSSGDNPPAIGPAAYIHISADDFARWMIVHLEGHNGKFSDFMPQETWRALHTAPPGSNPYYYTHALGWLATESLITHDGSNGLWWCRMWGSTLSKDALIICANSTTTPAVADSIAAEIKQQVLGLVG